MAKKGAGVTYEKGQLYMLAIGDIQPNPNQPRKYFDAEGLAELTGSVTDKGVLQPILVRLDEDGNIVLVAGERRLKAAQNAGLTEIPALFTDDNPEEVALIENSLRQNLTAVEEAEAAGRLVSELNYTPEQLQKIFGKKRQTINDILSLNRLPAAIRDECRTNPTCSRRVLVEIARKKQARAMLSLYKKYKEKGLTSDEVREEAKKERVEKTTEEQAAVLLTGIAALHTRLEKIDWLALSTDDRSQIQEAFGALTDAFTAIVEADGKKLA
jgi:ParB family transcriptional regulator, chromosome partitioning protein